MHSEWVSFINQKVPQAGATHNKAEEAGHDSITVTAESLLEVCRVLKEGEHKFNVLQVISGVDYPNEIIVNYMIASFINNTEMILKVKLPKKGSEDVPEIESVTSVWKAADFQERECFDMLGVKFLNHPDFRRILCPEDWEGYPLRKDYVVQEKYHNMTVNPPEKINTADHFFADELKKKMDPKLVSGSWKWGEK